MYIKSMVLEGFKSYAQRTEINGFDPLFNAITGLNGSGKSNILDGICFLLGITNLTQVRATSLQELVYKNGQAGVTKATVSIVFDNTNKKQSPLGYEQYDELTVTRQVVIGGRNKYLVNGSNANNTRVQDLFRSVQLNVNNPHFLIMQGRITKVLNMKPAEILSMIEEAAGTRLYESKKETAQKTIEKKDAKLQEIDTIVREEITPTLTKLREERGSYLEYQKIIRELEHLNKFYVAYQFVCAESQRKGSAEEQTTTQELMNKLKDCQRVNAEKIKVLDDEIAELERKRDSETGGVLNKLEAELADRQKSDAKATSSLANKQDSMRVEEKKVKELEKQRTTDVANADAKRKELAKLEVALAKLSEQSVKDKEAQGAAQKHLQAVNAGLSTNADGQDATLNDQLISAKKDISNSETDMKQAEMKLKHAQQELKKKNGELKQTEQGYKKDEALYDVLKKKIASLETDIAKLGYEDGEEEKLLIERKRLATELHNISEKVNQFEARFPQLQFDYKDPERGFNRSTVHGLVATLCTVKDPNTATALEVAAGGKLYNVVVDTELTGKKLIERGELRKRFTIIPLNKISANGIDSNTVRRAESLVGKANVHTALSLVGYDGEVEAAMKFVFGNSFVCTNMDVAKKVTFDDQIQKKSVTLDGDSFDPAGLLTGGARQQTAAILLKLHELKELRDSMNQTQQKLDSVDQELARIKKQAASFRDLKQQFDLKSQEAQLLTDRLKQSSHGQQLADIDTLTAMITDQQDITRRAKELYDKATGRVADIENKLKNAGAVKEKETKAAEAELERARKVAEASNKKTKEKEQEVETVKLELQELEEELATYKTNETAVKDAIQGYEKQIVELTKSAEASKLAVQQALDAVNAHKELLKGCNKGISERQSQQKSLQKESNAAELQLTELNHKIAKCSRDSKDAAKLVEQLLKDYSWIVDEKKFFGQPNTAYDFKANDPKEAGRRITKLTEMRDKLAKSVNMRAMNMLGKAEDQYNDLQKKRKIVLGDKAKIASVIAELDEKKNEALKKAYDQVTKDFGSIFSTLLPGTKAKLVPPEGLTILEGLEFKVAFGDVWKESLTELSGGQRSLVALSLILSLLLFKPAPLYILDEVDAALDLSHTQNIGQMLRSHFQHSQFIVVSLKDGMFNNANVLFKTKFVDGLSTVSRIAQSRLGGGAGSRPAGGGLRVQNGTGAGSGATDKRNKKKARMDYNDGDSP